MEEDNIREMLTQKSVWNEKVDLLDPVGKFRSTTHQKLGKSGNPHSAVTQ